MFTRDNTNWQQQAYVKVDSFQGNGAQFGHSVSLSADGNYLAASSFDSSAATGVNGDQSVRKALNSGAVYLFLNENDTWHQQAYLKASNTDDFGGSISLSGDGSILAVGAIGESSSASGLNGDQLENENYLENSPGAVYVFVRRDQSWFQQAYLKASNTGPAEEVCRTSISTSEGFFFKDVSGDEFGTSLSLSEDGETLVVGAPVECSSATGFGGDQTDNSAPLSGAVYLY